MAEVEVVTYRGWDVVRLRSPDLEVDVLPGKGGDVLSVRHRPSGTDLLWRTPWGVRARGAAGTAGDSVAALMEGYPGGWQTVFPNGGDPVVEHGVEWGMHGEAWLAPWDFTTSGDGLELTTRLVRSPFTLRKHVTVEGARLVVTETAENVGGAPVEVMWSHHPAFGAPLLAAGADVLTNARTFVADDARDVPAGDLVPGARGDWPLVPARDGGVADVSRVPDHAADRFGYLTDFPADPHVALRNGGLGLEARLEWDGSLMPHAWFWLEAHASPGFPWFGAAYVLGLEPATSWPGQGLAAVRAKTGSQLVLHPGRPRTATVALSVRAV